jgi:hypothetical protein
VLYPSAKGGLGAVQVDGFDVVPDIDPLEAYQCAVVGLILLMVAVNSCEVFCVIEEMDGLNETDGQVIFPTLAEPVPPEVVTDTEQLVMFDVMYIGGIVTEMVVLLVTLYEQETLLIETEVAPVKLVPTIL